MYHDCKQYHLHSFVVAKKFEKMAKRSYGQFCLMNEQFGALDDSCDTEELGALIPQTGTAEHDSLVNDLLRYV